MARMEKKGNTEFWWGNLKEKDLGKGGTLKFIFKEQDGRAKNGLIWPCITLEFLVQGVVGPLPNTEACGPPTVGRPRRFTPYIRIYIWRPSFLSTCRVLVGNYEGKKPLGRPKHRWEDNIKSNLNETGWQAMNLIRVTMGTSGGLFEHDTHSRVSIKCGKMASELKSVKRSAVQWIHSWYNVKSALL